MHLVEVLSKGDYPVEKTDTFEELARQFPEDSYVAACVAGNLNELRQGWAMPERLSS